MPFAGSFGVSSVIEGVVPIVLDKRPGCFAISRWPTGWLVSVISLHYWATGQPVMLRFWTLEIDQVMLSARIHLLSLYEAYFYSWITPWAAAGLEWGAPRYGPNFLVIFKNNQQNVAAVLSTGNPRAAPAPVKLNINSKKVVITEIWRTFYAF